MIFQEIYERCARKRPDSVMFGVGLQNVFSTEAINRIFAEDAKKTKGFKGITLFVGCAVARICGVPQEEIGELRLFP